MRKAERKAPWLPDNPPKKPDSSPPTGSQLEGNARRANAGESSSKANPVMTIPIESLTAVMAMAVDTGKKRAKTGVRIVPRPNPENSVSPEAISALTLRIKKISVALEEKSGPSKGWSARKSEVCSQRSRLAFVLTS